MILNNDTFFLRKMVSQFVLRTEIISWFIDLVTPSDCLKFMLVKMLNHLDFEVIIFSLTEGHINASLGF